MPNDSQSNRRLLYEIADSQGGFFTADQALKVGYAYSQQHFHRQSGAWTQVGRGLFRLRDYPPGEREDLIRWSLWSRNQKGIPQAVISHETALTVHDLSDVMPAAVHLTVPPGFRKRVPAGCVLHQAALSPADSEQRSGFRVTTPLRTLIDAAESALSQEHLDRAVHDALQRGLARRGSLATAACSPAARMRLDQALAAATDGEATP
jgi:predicted transcriptional regulator of viral defense system